MSGLNQNKTLLLFLFLAAVLFLPAYFINLERVQLIRDEAIRAIVAFEMLKSGDFITPTISGEPYLNKPPLFNWILALCFRLTGSYSEMVLRLPVIVSILFFALTIYYFTRKEFGARLGLVNALAFITYGRILFYESLHGLIDVTFSWLVYSFFMISWHLFRKKKFLLLFITAYAIMSLSYLLKGMPSLYFTAATLLVLFIQGGRFRMLFNWRHMAGIALMLAIVGGYYLLYFTRNEIGPERVFDVLTGEVTRRTVVRFGVWNTLLHILTYPFENIYHFLPWSLLVIVLFARGSFRKIRQNPFLLYSVWVFLINILPYWTSPEAYARYILMLIPLILMIFFALYEENRAAGSRVIRAIDLLLGVLIVVGALLGILFVVHPATRDLPYVWPVSIALIMLMSAMLFLYIRQPMSRLFWMAIALLVFRVAFNLVIIPSWEKSHPAVATKQMVKELAEETKDTPLLIYWNPDFKPDPYFHYRYNNEIFTYYLSTERGEIIRVSGQEQAGVIFIAQPGHLSGKHYTVLRELEPVWQYPVRLIRFEQGPN